LATVLLALGCSDNSTQPKETPKPRYPETTTPEIVISNLLESYQDRNIEQFTKLLHDNYVWYNQPQITPGSYTRDEDVYFTGDMFLAALHTYSNSNLWLDKLELILYPAEWQ
jgi:hypothetical protein